MQMLAGIGGRALLFGSAKPFTTKCPGAIHRGIKRIARCAGERSFEIKCFRQRGYKNRKFSELPCAATRFRAVLTARLLDLLLERPVGGEAEAGDLTFRVAAEVDQHGAIAFGQTEG
jgi:hypothetical protein